MTSLDLSRFSHLMFDCYGTLIDWETGLLDALHPVLERHGASIDDASLLARYAELEAAQEAGPYKRYRRVLREVMSGLGNALGFTATEADRDALAGSVEGWPPFSDSIESLARLATRYRLVVLSNIDDQIFQHTAQVLGDPFDAVFTAERIGSYKPSLGNFRFALERLGVAEDRVLHVAQSLFHDHVPAKQLGLSTVWVNRPSRRPGTGIAPPAEAAPDLEVPDLQSLARAAGL